MTTGTSRVRVNLPATTQITCSVLNKGHKHLIQDRPTIEDAKAAALKVYASGKRYAPTVRLRNGMVRKIIAAPFTVVTDHRLEFTGTIANGEELVRVQVVFDGDSAGYVEIID
jgi:hypothetical protein